MSSIITSMWEKKDDGSFNDAIPHYLGTRPAFISATQGNLPTEIVDTVAGSDDVKKNRTTGVNNLEEQLLLGESKITTSIVYEDIDKEVTIIEYRNRSITQDFYYVEIEKVPVAELIAATRALFKDDPDAGNTLYVPNGRISNTDDKMLEFNSDMAGASGFGNTDDHLQLFRYNDDELAINNEYSNGDTELVVEYQRLWYRVDGSDTSKDIFVAEKRIYQELDNYTTVIDKEGDESIPRRVHKYINKEEILQPKKADGTYGYITRAEYEAL